MVENLRLLFQKVPTVHIDHYGSLQDWIHKASNKKYWNQLVDCLLHPNMPLSECPAAWGPLTSWHAQRATNNNRRPANHDKDANNNKDNDNNRNNKSNEHHQPPPLPQQAPPHASRQQAAQPLPLNTNQNNGSTTPISVHKLDVACFTHSQSLDLGSEPPRLK
jgi:hypothetical protein